MMEIRPMLAVSNTGAGGRQPVDPVRLLESGGWIWDTKYDGIRAWLSPGPRCKVFSRTGAEITHKFPEIANPTRRWVDGEIVDQAGEFECVLTREAQENPAVIKKFAEKMPCEFVAFDLPMSDRTPWSTRRDTLRWDLSRGPGGRYRIADHGRNPDSLRLAKEQGHEGVVLKRTSSHYQPGKRSPDWIKIKFTERTSCIAYGYAPGQGSRERFGAMMLALLDEDDHAIPVGRCGSGFTERQIDTLKARMDHGEPFVVEIEHLGWTSGNQLRQPVFRGIRQDVDLAACTFDQH